MKKITFLLLIVSFIGCNRTAQVIDGTYPGYSCRESLLHYYSRCYDGQLTKEEFENKVTECEHDLKTKTCVKEQADILWCQGRTEKGIYMAGPARPFGVNTATVDGCDCSYAFGALKECRMKTGEAFKK
ncbi:MAG: hypothetical protein KBA28_05425 [Syntrophaceae bacterium]|jgi:hypothetical protein|nr:hypothetical protein [Syntrophaceae bacterium]